MNDEKPLVKIKMPLLLRYGFSIVPKGYRVLAISCKETLTLKQFMKRRKK